MHDQRSLSAYPSGPTATATLARGVIRFNGEFLVERPAFPCEQCSCGRPAKTVLLGTRWGPSPYCGIPNSGGDEGGRGVVHFTEMAGVRLREEGGRFAGPRRCTCEVPADFDRRDGEWIDLERMYPEEVIALVDVVRRRLGDYPPGDETAGPLEDALLVLESVLTEDELASIDTPRLLPLGDSE